MIKNKYRRLTEYGADDTCPRCDKPFVSGEDKDGDTNYYCDDCLRENEEECKRKLSTE